jgi:hypothetical protein
MTHTPHAKNKKRVVADRILAREKSVIHAHLVTPVTDNNEVVRGGQARINGSQSSLHTRGVYNNTRSLTKRSSIQ